MFLRAVSSQTRNIHPKVPLIWLHLVQMRDVKDPAKASWPAGYQQPLPPVHGSFLKSWLCSPTEHKSIETLEPSPLQTPHKIYFQCLKKNKIVIYK